MVESKAPLRYFELPAGLVPKVPDFWLISASVFPGQTIEPFVELEREAVKALGIKAMQELGGKLPCSYETPEDAVAVAEFILARRPELVLFAVCSDDNKAAVIPPNVLARIPSA